MLKWHQHDNFLKSDNQKVGRTMGSHTKVILIWEELKYTALCLCVIRRFKIKILQESKHHRLIKENKDWDSLTQKLYCLEVENDESPKFQTRK